MTDDKQAPRIIVGRYVGKDPWRHGWRCAFEYDGEPGGESEWLATLSYEYCGNTARELTGGSA